MRNQKFKDVTAELCQDAINDCATKSVDYRTTMNYAAKLLQKLHICWGGKIKYEKIIN